MKNTSEIQHLLFNFPILVFALTIYCSHKVFSTRTEISITFDFWNQINVFIHPIVLGIHLLITLYTHILFCILKRSTCVFRVRISGSTFNFERNNGDRHRRAGALESDQRIVRYWLVHIPNNWNCYITKIKQNSYNIGSRFWSCLKWGAN